MAEDINHIVAVITYENGHRITWGCQTIESAVMAWHREMTKPANAFNPAVAVEWIVGEPGGTDGLVIGAMTRPNPPKSEAWAQVVNIALEETDAPQ